MINFQNNSQFFKMKEVAANSFDETVSMFYVEGEESIACYQAVRDYMIFTNKRMIVVDVQGLTGKKRDYSSFPYKKIQAFSVKTAGVLDRDTDVDIIFAGLGAIHLEFTTSTNVAKLLRLIGGYTL